MIPVGNLIIVSFFLLLMVVFVAVALKMEGMI
jgi:hypothetical protein